MCFWGWLYEVVSNILLISAPILKYRYSIHNTYFADIVLIFIIIPFLHLLNDEDTKEIIYDEGLYQAIGYMLGIYVPMTGEPR